jgi:hypothetical protein
MAHRPDYESADYKEGYEDGKREASKEWVGLKTIDIANLLNDFNIPLHDFDIHLPDCNIPFEWDKKFLAFARATEAKLREING